RDWSSDVCSSDLSWNMGKKIPCLFNSHRHYFVNSFPFITNIQSLPIVALALANIARDIHIRKKVHLYFDKSFTLTGFTASTFYIKAKTPWPISAGSSLTGF